MSTQAKSGATITPDSGGGGGPPAAHAPTHAPATGTDPLACGAAGAIEIGDAPAEGTSDDLARADHKHSLAAPGLPEPVTAGIGNAGASPVPAREDHEHPWNGIAVPVPHAPTHAPATGTDPLACGAAGAIEIGDAPAEGTSDDLARADHKHSLAAPGLPAPQVIGAGTAGTDPEPARGDHVHPMAAALPINFLDGLTHRMHSATAIHVAAGSARDSTDAEDLVLAASVILDCATAGPAIQGRDQAGAFAANTMVAIYLIGGAGNPVATIASTVFPTFGSPALPGTYTKFRWLGSLSITGIANNVRPYQQSGNSCDRWHLYTDQTAAELTGIGTQGNSAGTALAVVTTSTSWRNWVAGGTDVNFGPTRLIPPYPVAGAVGPINFSAKGPLVRFHVTIGNDAARGFVEFAPASGAVQAPAASPTNGSGMRCYQDNNSNSRTWFEMRVGEGQSIQYRNATLPPDYAIAVQGFLDQL